jgi:signal transduction histidine kinase
MTSSPRALTIGTGVLGAAATLVVSLGAAVRFTYDAPSLHVFLETAAALIALLAAYLVFGRFRESSRVDDLVLSCGLALLSASNLLFLTLPAASAADPGRLPTWTSLMGRLLGALFIACAAFCPPSTLRDPRRSAIILFGTAGTVLAAIAVCVAFIDQNLPAGIDPALSPPRVLGRSHLYGHPVLLAVQLLSALLYAAATVGFTRRAERTGDELMRWFSVGSVLASAAAIHYFLFPSLYSRWVDTGDFVRLLSHLVLLAGAAREIGRYWRRLAAVAVLEERRRIARELHDGLAQELAFILRRTKHAPARDPVLAPIAGAADRAIADARRAIVALTRSVDEPLDIAVGQAVEEVAERFGQRLILDLEAAVCVDAVAREELVRIAREAVSNAARHGRAGFVRVELSNSGRIRLKIADDGVGFEPNGTDRQQGFGVVSMRERALALNADFRLESAPGAGTEVEVILP